MKKLFILIIMWALLNISTSFASWEVKVVEWKKYDLIRDLFFSPDSKNFVYIAGYNEDLWSENWRWFIVNNWVEWKKFYYIDNLKFSPDSKNMIGNFKDTWVWGSYLAKDWIRIDPKNYDINNYATYSPDWKDFAYVNSIYWKSFIVKNWVEWKKYDSVRDLKYSQDSKDLYYTAESDWKSFIVKNWVEWKKYDSVTSFTLSPDWKSSVYIAVQKKNWKMIIVKDWVEWNPYHYIDPKTFTFSKSGFIYVAEDWWKAILIKDWVEIRKFDSFFIGFAASQDNNNYAYSYNQWWKEILVKDWIESSKYDSISYLKYSSNNSLAFIAEKNWKQLVINDWVEWKLYDDISGLEFSPDWKKLAFEVIQNQDKRFIVINWVEWKKYGYINSKSFIFSPDGQSFAYVAEDGWSNIDILIKDWIEFKTSRSIDNLIFSPDSKKLAFIEHSDQGSHVTLLIENNGQVINKYKSLTNSQIDLINIKIANFNIQNLKDILEKIRTLSLKTNLSTKNKDLLNDIKIVIEEKMNTYK